MHFCGNHKHTHARNFMSQLLLDMRDSVRLLGFRPVIARVLGTNFGLRWVENTQLPDPYPLPNDRKPFSREAAPESTGEEREP